MLITALGCWLGFAGFCLLASREVLPERRWLLALRAPDDPADAWGPSWLEVAMQDLTAVGGMTLVGLATIIAVTLALLRRRFAPAVFLVSTIASARLLVSGLKAAFSRSRPDFIPHLAGSQEASFPSGHGFMIAVVLGLLAWSCLRPTDTRATRIAVWSWVAAVAILVGASRVYLGVHWPTDVVAGWLAGAGWWCSCLLVWRIYATRAEHRASRVGEPSARALAEQGGRG